MNQHVCHVTIFAEKCQLCTWLHRKLGWFSTPGPAMPGLVTDVIHSGHAEEVDGASGEHGLCASNDFHTQKRCFGSVSMKNL